MDAKSKLIIIVAVIIAVAAAAFYAMAEEDRDEAGSETDGYKVSLKLSLNDGLRCYVGGTEYFDGDTIVFESDSTMKLFAPQTGTITCNGHWQNEDGTATSGGDMSEYGDSMEYDLTWTAYYGDMTGTVTATFVASEPKDA